MVHSGVRVADLVDERRERRRRRRATERAECANTFVIVVPIIRTLFFNVSQMTHAHEDVTDIHHVHLDKLSDSLDEKVDIGGMMYTLKEMKKIETRKNDE